MEDLSSGSGHLDSNKMHDPVDPVEDGSKEEDQLFESTLRRSKEDTFFQTYFLKALTSGDHEYISRIFGGLRTNYPRLSQLIQQQVAMREARLANPNRLKGITYYLPEEHVAIAKARRRGRKKNAADFRREYYFGSGIDQKTLVWPSATYPWTDELCGGITWLGLHGIDSICVVTRARDLDVRRVHRYLKYRTVEQVLCQFRKTVISEIEDFACSSPKPFGFVSVVLGIDDAHEGSGLLYMSDEDEEYEKLRKIRREYMPKDPRYDEKKMVKYLRDHMRKDTSLINSEAVKSQQAVASSSECDKSKAIEYLQEKMKTMNKEAFTVDETIKTAISAFQHLFQTEFKSNDIGVSVMDPKYFINIEKQPDKDVYVKHLEMNEIEGHLTAINELPSFDCIIPPPPALPPSLPILV